MPLDLQEIFNIQHCILMKSFVDHDLVKNEVTNKEKFYEYLKSIFGKKTECKIDSNHVPGIDKILKQIEEGLIYGSISFYDLYRGSWIKNYSPVFGRKAKTAAEMVRGTPEDAISLTRIAGEKIIQGPFLLFFDKQHNGDEQIVYYKLNKKECTFEKQVEKFYIRGKKLDEFPAKWIPDKPNGDGDIEGLNSLFSFLSMQRKALQWSYLYCFSPMTSVPAGVIFLFMNCELPPQYIQYFQILSKKLFLPLSLGMSIAKTEEQIKKHGTRAAAASIIGRNMSHNIGSHVIYYLFSRIDSMDDRNPLHKVVKEFATFTYNLSASEYAPNEPQDFISSFESKYKSSDSLKNFEQIYRELALFLNYLQARMDYVALACTIEPKYGQGLKISDMIQEFQDNNILKEGIVASEGVKTLNIKRDCKSSYNGLVTIPFGEIGKHAFYSILENIIRNSAKRGKPGKDLTLYYSEKMSDDKKYVVLEIYDGLGTYNVAKERMNLDDEGKSALTSDYILESGELNHDFLGIKEIRLSVAFLRMVAFYEELQMAPRGLELEPIKVKNGSRESLKYIIHLKPYKYLLMINNDEGELAMVDEKYYIDKCGFNYLEKHSKDINEYKIAVSETEIQKDQRQKFNLPNRVVQCNNEIKTENWDDVILKQYKKWIEVTYNCDPEKLAIYFKPLGDPEKEQKLREAWKNVINVGENQKSSHIHFIGHMEELIDYKNYFDKKKSNNIVSAESVEKSSHILKQMLMQPPEDEFHKNLLKLELLESALTKVLIIDERLYNKYQCHFNDFEIDGKAYTLKFIPEAEATYTKGTEIGIHGNDLMDIGEWLSKKKLSEIKLNSDKSKLTYNSEDSFCLKKNGLQDAMSEVPNNNHLFKFLEALTTLYERQINLYIFSLKNISICSLFEKTDGIDVVDLSGSTLFSVKDKSSELPIDAGNGEGGFHFLSVHLGMIDTIADFLKTSQANIVKFFDDKLKNTYFIIHTGRGKTINIEKTTDTEKYPLRFTDFTTLNTWVNGSKWLLVQGLYSIKKQVY